jgi:tRNA 2-thiouridine synthesizing protein E
MTTIETVGDCKMQTMYAIQPQMIDLAACSFDEYGFLIDSELWSEELAWQLAQAEGIDALSHDHFKVISFIRYKYLTMKVLPPMRHVCRQLGVDRGQVKGLFGGCRQLWRIAGLPYPGAEAMAYMD